ncbi:MAG TPA: hypothetical protein VFV11_09470 [Solimonas sp.]|nr:hypothetical protein [Solimonas sp.]
MESKIRSEPWYDGTWWEATLPTGWLSVGRDKAIKGWPNFFTSPSGAQLFVHVNDGSTTRMDVSCAPPELTDTQKIAYTVAAYDTAYDDIEPADLTTMNPLALAALQFELVASRPRRLKEAGAKLKRVDRGPMVGFIYPLRSKAEVGWHGHFAIGSCWLHSWLSMKEWDDVDADCGLEVLASITLHRPSH